MKLKKIIFLLFAILMSSCKGTIKKDNIDKNMYVLTYVFNNYSLGPIDGKEKVKLLIRNNKIVSILDLKKYKIYPSSHYIKGINVIRDVLLNNRNLKYYNIKYAKNGFPKIIYNKEDNLVGSSYLVKIIDYKKVNNDFKFNLNKRKIEDFKYYYRLWKNKHIKSYLFTYQDSNFKKIYPDGLDINVKNNRIISVKDIFHYKDLKNFHSLNLVTIDELYKRLCKELKSIILIDYNEKYGYPEVIKIGNRKILIKLYIFNKL